MRDAPNAQPSTIRVLIVDDEPTLVKAMGKMLKNTGWQLVTAGNGPEALRRVGQAEGIQLLITDIMMPEMDGYALANELCKRNPDLRVLFVTGYLDSLSPERAPAHIQSDFMMKPFTMSELMERARALVNRGSPPDEILAFRQAKQGLTDRSS